MVLCTNSSEVRFRLTSSMCVPRLQECGFVRAGVAEPEAEGGREEERVLSVGRCPPCVQTPGGTAVPLTRFTEEC